MQMTGDAADGAHGDESGKQAFVALENFEAGFGPKLAAVPAEFGAEAAQPGNSGGLLGQVFETQTCEGCAAGESRGEREQDEPGQEADPEKLSAFGETHNCTSSATVGPGHAKLSLI